MRRPIVYVEAGNLRFLEILKEEAKADETSNYYNSIFTGSVINRVFGSITVLTYASTDIRKEATADIGENTVKVKFNIELKECEFESAAIQVSEKSGLGFKEAKRYVLSKVLPRYENAYGFWFELDTETGEMRLLEL